MTPYEAINYIKQCGLNIENPTHDIVKECVIDALKKQIPETPLPYKGWEGKGPTCGVIFLDRSTNYCGKCGQALNWGDIE